MSCANHKGYFVYQCPDCREPEDSDPELRAKIRAIMHANCNREIAMLRQVLQFGRYWLEVDLKYLASAEQQDARHAFASALSALDAEC